MTGNHQGHMIRGAGAGNGAHGFRFADRLSDLLIRTRAARRDALQLFPYSPLKSGCLDVERQFDPRTLACQVLEYLTQPKIQRRADYRISGINSGLRLLGEERSD